MARVYNFSAGPAVLPEEVLKEAADEMLDYKGCGMSVMEMSHRSKMFQQIIDEAEQDIRDLMNSDDNIRNAVFFNILKYAWGLCLDKSVTSVLSVDEAHVLLSSRNELGAEFLAQIQRRSRKYNSGTIIITQQPTDFAAPNLIMHGKAIFDNASYYLVMGLKKQAVDDLSLLIDLNEAEKNNIKYYNQGQGLFICGSRRMQIYVICTNEELDSFGSGGGL